MPALAQVKQTMSIMMLQPVIKSFLWHVRSMQLERTPSLQKIVFADQMPKILLLCSDHNFLPETWCDRLRII